jgi:protein-S-isoprenylcysteine O-methyltransferase Ste14
MQERNDAAAVRVFPPVLPLITVLLGVALQYLLPLDVGISLSGPVRHSVGVLIVLCSVVGLGLWAVILVRGSGQSENPWKPTTEIIERGPYRISRNPMYLQMVLVCVGFSVILWNVWILILTPLCTLALQTLVIRHEEVYLESRFGESYLAYKRRVRRWI